MKNNDYNQVLFVESYTAAQSLKNFWTKLASTYGCIKVTLSRNTLTIRPHWFANWLISPLGLDLNHEITIAYIKSVTQIGKWFRYGKVEVHFKTMDGEDRKIWLYLKKYREFIETLAKLK